MKTEIDTILDQVRVLMESTDECEKLPPVRTMQWILCDVLVLLAAVKTIDKGGDPRVELEDVYYDGANALNRFDTNFVFWPDTFE